MNQQQYENLLANRRMQRDLRLDDTARRDRSAPLSRVISAAARALRRRVQAETAWNTMAPPAWRAGTRVAGVEGETLLMAVENATLGYELNRQRAGLQRELARRVPGVRMIRFLVRGADPQDAADDS